MKSASVNVFFSCSFNGLDKDINSFFQSICLGLDVKCSNVDTAYSALPPDQAKKMINDSQGLIAICTRRTKIDDDKYAMSSAVQDEISIAYACDLPVLMFVEEGVLVDGFKSNYGTYLYFNREVLSKNEVFQKIIKAIHEFKMGMVSDYDILVDQGIDDFYADYLYRLIELKYSCGDYFWEYTFTKKIKFVRSYKKALKTAAWAQFPMHMPSDAALIDWDIIVHDGSKDFKIIPDIQEHTALSFEAMMKIEPNPEKDDFIDFSVITRSKYFNPLWEDQVDRRKLFNINDKDYFCVDGTLPIQRTKKAILEFRFPREYGLLIDEVVPVVGSYTSNLDYLVPSELERLNLDKEYFAGNLTLRLCINSPLLHHYYGVAWNPKKRPDPLP